MATSSSSPDTRAVHAGRDDLAALGVHVPPIDLSTTYPLPDVQHGGDSYEVLATGHRPGAQDSYVYQRLWNPTVARFEGALAELESCAEAVAFASGMAALTATLLATVAAGKPHVVAVRPLYGGTDHVLATGLLGTRVSWATAATVAESIRGDTGLVVVETPANPSLELVDLSALVSAAGSVPVVVDNTFATPALQNPARHGARLVLHSATKYLGGHGDVIAGVVACTEEWAERIRQVRAVTGALLHPTAAYELHRGLQTLPVRVRAQQAGAEKVAGWLSSHPAVESVRYPGLPGCDPHGLVGRQMAGPGGMLAFTVVGGHDAAAAVAGRCRLITHAVSLGGVDTLIQHPSSLTHRPVAADARPDGGLLRLSLGLEDPSDVIADLQQALSRLPAQA
ncbi:MAG TPA: PLP-dependent aspartate aminotransferase family protein [Segeticoccus sp.]|uniref:trans-sulfuration enzyme family protein n=1 Tax=Segeticoccus sp. TaxID=2706531 RepID=UPI002D80F040|nr:PLP-dependent aspartate aminotransferase family protein [Segeticoccus sp.]HET8600391.1 PLP-dependent aspartate aminotransferase family protein [Segeticoccus sp.]